jgi:hypothetical protein
MNRMVKRTKCPQIDVTRYVGRWVALHPVTHRIVVNGDSLKVARRAAMAKGVDRAVLMIVPDIRRLR